MREKTENDRHAEQQRVQCQVIRRARRREGCGQQVDEDRPHRHAEHCQRDCHECEVIPHRHAEDAREEDLIHHRGECHQKKARVDPPAERGPETWFHDQGSFPPPIAALLQIPLHQGPPGYTSRSRKTRVFALSSTSGA